VTHDEGGTGIPYDEAVGAVGAACLGELGWVGPSGAYALTVVPLLLADRPAVALPYAWAEALRPLGDVGWAVLSLTEPRMTGKGWRPCALAGRATLIDDVEGAVVVEQLLDQELRKHPPSRVLADSPLLRRENWWYVPRLLVQLEVTRCDAVPPRTDPAGQALLVTSRTDGVPRTHVVAVPDWAARPLPVRAVNRQVLPMAEGPSRTEDGDAPARRGSGNAATRTGGDAATTSPHAVAGGATTAALLATDASVPDLERWSQHLLVGHWRATDGGGELDVVEGQEGAPALPGPLSLRARWRRHRDLERACRAGIAAAEARLR
jgi:hypothetical protein